MRTEELELKFAGRMLKKLYIEKIMWYNDTIT